MFHVKHLDGRDNSGCAGSEFSTNRKALESDGGREQEATREESKRAQVARKENAIQARADYSST
ncbi:hypothetical protein, partial [Eggerthella sp.]|uniref:hypothetical protein n=1 Tax=Eggerthella sp. TaxID=1929886 RepID=UPI002908527F